ncbi:alpha/beta hydrolase-fold protein [Psychroserpens luteolus]|uniref:alpha/beta hydrolase-fold protein n=1 Tax=Psychroserpens luteolus TaxID=2855840 RepID=UPI001E5DCC9D|nr:alpha/beta hydrolase-fold protein [Psychroserpens luteolus]MCD2259988.1 esterase [Psychroserpens luteolus]
MKLLFVFITCSFLTTICPAQESNSQITIGVNHNIKSFNLNEERAIQIYTPDGYSESEQKYPVLYILDGQQYFLSGVSIQKALRRPRAIPKMIVVGITDKESSRWTWFGDEKEKFSSFLIDEVIPFINSNYKTNEEHVIFGWEGAAYYASELILKHPEVFNGAILSNGGYASKEIVKDFYTNKATYLYMANSKKDIYNISYTEEFNEILKEHSPKNLVWKYDLYNDEIHESLAHLALYKGLKFYYHNYNSLVFESIQEYIDLGGMDYLTRYFKERAQRFGGDETIDNSTKNGLIWLAWNRDNFEYFNLFMTEFKDVLTTKRYASAYWQNRFGQFYLKHKDYQNAIKHFNVGLTKYPNTRFEKQMKEGLIDAKSRKD